MKPSFLAVLLLAGCASTPEPSPPPEYKIPVVKADGTVERFTVEPDKEPTGERMLFCIENPVQVLCISELDGRALVYRMPILPRLEPQVPGS